MTERNESRVTRKKRRRRGEGKRGEGARERSQRSEQGLEGEVAEEEK